MKKINKKSYEGICRKVASLCVASLLLNVSMAGTLFIAPEAQGAPIENEELCEAAIDVVLIMDRSGSMGWEIPTRISQAKNAANDFLGNLGADDQSAMVSYASEVSLDKELSGEHSATQTAVNNLMAKGGTNIGDAIYLSNQELGSARTNPQAVKAAILLTDGRATCPHYNSDRFGMCGFVEDEEDIQYTLDAATAAADLGYKIFTIGLGRQYKINEEMLQEVADTTGAEYYYAPTSGDLESIYESIRWQLCEYGSISGCKYDDLDNNGNPEDFVTEDTISGWEIILTGETNGPITQLTDENGCYKFSGLLSGNYVVSEGSKDGITDFVQTYPQDPSLFYDITLGDEEDLTGYDFGNYFPICGNNILDDDFGETCDDGNNIDNDGCSSECLLEEESFCGDGIKQTPNDEGTGGPLNDGNEECDGDDGVGANQTCSADCVLLERLCRVKLDAVVVMDRSGSMDWDIPTRLSQAKIAANSFVGKLGSDDRSALVSFSTTADLGKPFSNDHAVTQTMIDNLTAFGATNIGDAIGLANDEFSSSVEDVLKIEILLTDGVANKPNGNGNDENPLDVAYTEEKAAEAALAGIKIFTIGLGSDINETMLQNIANDTGAQYYNAPTAEELDEIFGEIAYDICQYGSISGCKYEDADNDGEIIGESTLSGWEINLSGDANLTQLTNGDGCYSFTGLLDGNYTVSEASDQGVDFVQTYPLSLSYDLVLANGEEMTGYDFGNYLPKCGNGITDYSFGEECDDGGVANDDGCSSDCKMEIGGGGSPAVILAGDIVINEIMQNPDAVNDNVGEWFELYNTTGSSIELEGCVISDNGSESHTIIGSLIIPADGYAVFARNDDSLVNGGIAPEYIFNFTLGNTDDEIILTCGSVEIDRVEYGGSGWPAGTGVSMVLNNPANDNNDPVNWCLSTDPYGDGDLGTPGAFNDSCEGACADSDGDGVCDAVDNCPDVANPNQEDSDADGIGDACETTDPICVDVDGDGYGIGDTTNCSNPEIDCDDTDKDVNPGVTEICDNGKDDNCDGEIDEGCGGGDDPITPDVIINEIAWMGTDASTGDEWIELRNMTSEAIVLDDWTLNAQDGSPSITLEGSISANGYYLLERTDEETVPNISSDKIYTGALGDDGEFLELRNTENALINEVDASNGWPAGDKIEPRHSMERCADDNWYDSGVAGGTPKAENDCGGACADSDGDGVCDDIDNCPNTPNPGQEDADNNGVGDACETTDPVCVDVDGDGYGTGDTTSCPNPEIDCNDEDEDINPGATEICDNGKDDNCDGEIDEGCGGGSISVGDVIINELMWMGSFEQGEQGEEVGGSADEWIELRNMTGENIDLIGCKLYKKNGDEIADLGSYSISANGYLVISREDQANSKIDTATQNILSYLALSNDELKIELRCEEVVIDTAGDDGGVPLAGDNGDIKKSMSRKGVPGDGSLADNWYTALTAVNWDDEATEWGTPGSANSL